MQTFYTLQDAVEVLNDLLKDADNMHHDKIKTDLNSAALILADKGYLLTSVERESLSEFITELNSNVNHHKPVIENEQKQPYKFDLIPLQNVNDPVGVAHSDFNIVRLKFIEALHNLEIAIADRNGLTQFKISRLTQDKTISIEGINGERTFI